MNGTNLFKIALRALANNKLRAFLTMLGIIIGVASVIAMLAIGQGSKRSIQQQISEMGSNMIMIHPGAEMRGGVRQDPSAMQTLKLENYEKLSEECTYLSGISPNVSSSGQLVAGSNNYPSSVSGVSIDYLNIRQLSVEQGGNVFRKRYPHRRQSLRHRQDHCRQSFSRRLRPYRKSHPLQPNTHACCGRIEVQRLQLHGTGSRRCGTRPIHYRNETIACTNLSGRYLCLRPDRRHDRRSGGRNQLLSCGESIS